MSIRAVPGGVQLALHVQPGARTTAVAGRHGDAIKVRLAAPPVDGRANEALLLFVAEVSGVPVRAVTMVRGASSRAKVIEVQGLTAARAATLFLGG
ncbi:MAG: DUF167 domain-containing protein [Gemmatimonadetes bacterium]|nr:DUF167 domain-containing protein [Gemmatimonadota bacterium]MBP6445011.1 DUF167 domain-containing protein [Gemmatimonadales bacterium]MBK9547935.1 DUF167 domain-containing protein [Gemmatimonadota bacterium]MBP6572347.1 DUF167 domain-containing protein [Gemmatimonadales bacterium]MBP7622057.1 DUF167 domain-containing protein [Gemmatimonadales bacterium]